jgi:hypothetical protein
LFGELEKDRMRKMIWQMADFCGVEVLTYAIMTGAVDEIWQEFRGKTCAVDARSLVVYALVEATVLPGGSMRSDALLATCAYVNPVRAKLVDDPKDYLW